MSTEEKLVVTDEWQETRRIKDGRRKGRRSEDHFSAFCLLDMLRIWQCCISGTEKILLVLEHLSVYISPVYDVMAVGFSQFPSTLIKRSALVDNPMHVYSRSKSHAIQ
ncbi:UNVERIFIED_CONTAM: hypothetical protein K2H54_063041 [Gekko kuhli]